MFPTATAASARSERTARRNPCVLAGAPHAYRTRNACYRARVLLVSIRSRNEIAMIRHNISSLLLAGAFIVAPMSLAIAHPLDAAYAPQPGVITVQGWPGAPVGPPGGPPGWSPDQGRHEHCLRSQAHEIRRHIRHAPPWEQEGLQHQLWQIRQQARGACPGGGNWG